MDFYAKTLISYTQRFQYKCVSGLCEWKKWLEGKAHNIDLIHNMEIENE